MKKGSGAARKSIISTEMKKDDFAKEIMERMEELEFDVEDAVEAAKGFIMLQTSEKEFILGFIKGMAAQKELSEAREKIA